MNNNYNSLKAYNTINNFYKKSNEDKTEEELNKKLMNQIKLNDKLKKEIEILKEKINRSTIFTDQSTNNNLRILTDQNIITFKEKINSISDIIFSLSLLFNGIQNKTKKEKEFSDIKKNLLEITNEISELKSILYQISLENEDNSGLIKSTNQSINFSEDFHTINNENSDLNLNEISSLKEKLRTSEKKLLELKNIYDSDIESRNLIEKLLKQNLEENKATYEAKIMKYKKKYEEKEKEVNEIRKKLEDEEMDILNKMKKDNEENIQKLKDIYELKINNNNKKILSEKYKDLKEEKSINLIIINTSMNDNSSFEKEDYEKKFEQIEQEKKQLEINIEKEKMEFRENNNKNMNQILELKNEILNYKNNENELKEEINLITIEKEKKIKKLEEEIKITKEENNELNKELKELNKIKKDYEEINNKLNKKDKEIITLITNNTKEKKNLMEQTNNQIEKLNQEIKDLTKTNESYKEQINSLQKKLSEIETLNETKKKNIIIKKECELTFINNKNKEILNPNLNLIEKTEITLNISSSYNSLLHIIQVHQEKEVKI